MLLCSMLRSRSSNSRTAQLPTVFGPADVVPAASAAAAAVADVAVFSSRSESCNLVGLSHNPKAPEGQVEKLGQVLGSL
jgi:hypothetical protein